MSNETKQKLPATLDEDDTLDAVYAPPGVAESPTKTRKKRAKEPPGYELFSPLAIVVITVLFTPLFGGFLVAANWRRAGEPDKARAASFLGMGAFVALVVIAVVLADWVPDAVARGGSIGATVALAMGWRREQRPLWDAHVAAGGARASALLPALAGVVFVVVAVVVVAGALG